MQAFAIERRVVAIRSIKLRMSIKMYLLIQSHYIHTNLFITPGTSNATLCFRSIPKGHKYSMKNLHIFRSCSLYTFGYENSLWGLDEDKIQIHCSTN